MILVHQSTNNLRNCFVDLDREIYTVQIRMLDPNRVLLLFVKAYTVEIEEENGGFIITYLSSDSKNLHTIICPDARNGARFSIQSSGMISGETYGDTNVGLLQCFRAIQKHDAEMQKRALVHVLNEKLSKPHNFGIKPDQNGILNNILGFAGLPAVPKVQGPQRPPGYRAPGPASPAATGPAGGHKFGHSNSPTRAGKMRRPLKSRR